MADARQLEAFARDVDAADLSDREAFSRVLRKGMDLLELLDSDLSERFDASRPSVNRWRNGKTAPHPAVRQLVLRYLRDRTAALLHRKLAAETVERPRHARAAQP